MRKLYIYINRRTGNFSFSPFRTNIENSHCIGEITNTADAVRLLTPYANLFERGGYSVRKLQEFYNVLCKELDEQEYQCEVWEEK